ncbi:copper chaperone PCu(A)C [Streptomyces libani]|uniref:Copper chaperone PCu(A)C n=2 Tax=Streptomyces nigrescens TaxID=1920 RepID=A0A640TIF0_STRNI|nr:MULTISPECIES: copper chaperone PCu(A)C [Streptomyces]MCW7986120.1 copper chaperone [Streptomyces platensis subsp. clarensis]MYT12116.1 copper chaperone PCu(A)C [Streptomyces sp. SID4951]MYX06654.1 copper chaperone PCu(A)C [Streptomyces sp. SID8375]AWN28410.1 copper chaperone PCu(A)C [Streptomyces sp. NEAU-S7GS2]MCX5444817.1 copper chaperone PCu(A)C [Streptomyces libani]
MNRRTSLAAALTLTAGLTLAGCGGDSAPKIEVTGAYMPQPVTDQMAGAYFTVKNNGDSADKLTSVTTNLAKDISLHKTVGSKMERVKSLTVPANGTLRLSHGGNHLMFMGLKSKPTKDDVVTVTLHFATADPVRVAVPVKAADYQPKH